MIRRRSAESLRVAAASFLFALVSTQTQADTNDSTTATSAGTSSASSNPAQAFTRMFGGDASGDGSAAPRRHRRSHHNPANVPPPDSPGASWLPQSSPAAASATTTSEPTHGNGEAPIASTFSKAPAESRVSDWLPSNGSSPVSQESLSTSARIDLIAEKVGRQATVDYNSRIQEPNGVIAFRAIDNQTGERQTIRIDRSGDIKLKSGWPN